MHASRDPASNNLLYKKLEEGTGAALNIIDSFLTTGNYRQVIKVDSSYKIRCKAVLQCRSVATIRFTSLEMLGWCRSSSNNQILWCTWTARFELSNSSWKGNRIRKTTFTWILWRVWSVTRSSLSMGKFKEFLLSLIYLQLISSTEQRSKRQKVIELRRIYDYIGTWFKKSVMFIDPRL